VTDWLALLAKVATVIVTAALLVAVVVIAASLAIVYWQ